MIKVGEGIVFIADGKDIKCRVDSVSNDNLSFTVTDAVNTLSIKKKYGLSANLADGMMVGEGYVTKAEKSELKTNLIKYYVTMDGPLRKIQKRNFVRHECHLKAVFHLESHEKERHSGIITNISANGMKIVSNTRFLTGAVINVQCKLGDYSFQSDAVILEVIKMDKMTSAYEFAMRLQFKGATRKNEEAVYRYIFSEYRKSKERK